MSALLQEEPAGMMRFYCVEERQEDVMNAESAESNPQCSWRKYREYHCEISLSQTARLWQWNL